MIIYFLGIVSPVRSASLLPYSLLTLSPNKCGYVVSWPTANEKLGISRKRIHLSINRQCPESSKHKTDVDGAYGTYI